MIIGVPKEIKEQEYRVALLPSGAYQLIKRGHTVLVERGAGVGAGYPDAEYEIAGARGLSRGRGSSMAYLRDAPAGYPLKVSLQRRCKWR